MGKEAWRLGQKLRNMWKKHKFLQEFVTFQFMGGGMNVQWVFAVQTEDDAVKFSSGPNYWMGVLHAVNLEMIERPELLEPPVKNEE